MSATVCLNRFTCDVTWYGMAQTAIPTAITAGDTITWSRSLSNYPASAPWALKYRLANASAIIDIAASAIGNDHQISIDAATSATFAAGNYDWQEYVENGTERYTIATGRITILPNLAAQTAGFDNRSTARKTLEAIDAALLAQGANAWTLEYQIDDRQMKFRSVADFMALRSKLQQEVRAEERAARILRGESAGNKLLVRF